MKVKNNLSLSFLFKINCFEEEKIHLFFIKMYLVSFKYLITFGYVFHMIFK